jgi:hypothetical protein
VTALSLEAQDPVTTILDPFVIGVVENPTTVGAANCGAEGSIAFPVPKVESFLPPEQPKPKARTEMQSKRHGRLPTE